MMDVNPIKFPLKLVIDNSSIRVDEADGRTLIPEFVYRTDLDHVVIQEAKARFLVKQLNDLFCSAKDPSSPKKYPQALVDFNRRKRLEEKESQTQKA